MRAGLERLQRPAIGADQFDRPDIGSFDPKPPDAGSLDGQFACFLNACEAMPGALFRTPHHLRRIVDSSTILSAKPGPAANSEV
jgi:hypothetical protein